MCVTKEIAPSGLRRSSRIQERRAREQRARVGNLGHPLNEGKQAAQEATLSASTSTNCSPKIRIKLVGVRSAERSTQTPDAKGSERKGQQKQQQQQQKRPIRIKLIGDWAPQNIKATMARLQRRKFRIVGSYRPDNFSPELRRRLKEERAIMSLRHQYRAAREASNRPIFRYMMVVADKQPNRLISIYNMENEKYEYLEHYDTEAPSRRDYISESSIFLYHAESIAFTWVCN